MTFIDFIILLIVAGIAGAIGQLISGFSRGGCFVSIGLGFIGALLGTWLARQLGLPAIFVIHLGSTEFPIIWAIIGAALFVAIISLLSGFRRRV
jgi:uncharacterized membrane protein YeaQ/YmgE (transglycosylase-associated protein family)